MKIVVPLAYTVRGIPKNGRVERDLHVVELIDWELREADETEAPIGVIAVVKNGHPTLRERDQLVIRRFEGGFLRHASEAEYNWANPLRRQELPVWRDGRIHSNYIVGFLALLPMESYGALFLAAKGLMTNGNSEKSNVDPAEKMREILYSDRDEALERTAKSMENLVLVGDVLWQKAEPRWKLKEASGYVHAFVGYRHFGEEPHHRFLPLGDYDMLEAAADALGGHLVSEGTIPFVAEGIVIDKGPEMSIRRIADFLIEDLAASLGDFPADLADAWLALRDCLDADDECGSDELAAVTDALLSGLAARDWETPSRVRDELSFAEAVYGQLFAVRRGPPAKRFRV
jgi:hypothetical protein